MIADRRLAGFGASAVDQRVALAAQLTALRQAITLAQQGVAKGIAGQDVALAQLQAQYAALSRQYTALQQQAAAEDVAAGRPTALDTALESVASVFQGISLTAAVALGVAAYLVLRR